MLGRGGGGCLKSQGGVSSVLWEITTAGERRGTTPSLAKPTKPTSQPAEMGERRKNPLGLQYIGVNIVRRHLTGYCTGTRLQALEYEI